MRVKFWHLANAMSRRFPQVAGTPRPAYPIAYNGVGRDRGDVEALFQLLLNGA
jgi:hypothetical protein